MHADTPKYRYLVYGMHVESNLQLPEVHSLQQEQLPRATPADIEIVLGSVPEPLRVVEGHEWTIEVSGSKCLIQAEGIARFLIEEGQKITVDIYPGATQNDVRVFLIGSALGAAAHQKGLVPLHVSAVQTPGGAIAFTGDSGAGKSTMAAHLNRTMGWPLISDDVSCLSQTDSGPVIESGVHTMKLWQDTLHSLDRTSNGLKRDLTRENKYHALDATMFGSGQFPLKRLVYLEWGETLELEPLTGQVAFKTALKSVYRPELAIMCGNKHNAAATAILMASTLEISKLTRPRSLSVSEGVSDSINTLLNLGA